MCAFVYALNDADERVRHQAAVEIAAQLKRNRCCCSEKVAQALMCALGDCDKKVRKAAEKGLCLCGYEVADACNLPCAVASCGSNPTCGAGPAAAAGCGPAAATNCGPAGMPAAAPAVVPAPAPAAAPAPVEEAAPAPAPPAAEPEAYFPARIREQQTGASRARSKLANLFGLR